MPPVSPSLVFTLPNGFSFEMVYVEGGKFGMGVDGGSNTFGEFPIHQVQLDSFFIGRTPVTQIFWNSVVGKAENPSFFVGSQRPVEGVSWINILKTFIPKINEQTHDSRPVGFFFRLPTEAEWEFAAKGGCKSKGYLFAGSDNPGAVAWYSKNCHGETKDVGQKQPNELGLFDMSGNVWEWCWDWKNNNYYRQCKEKGLVANPLGPEKGTNKVLRGGAWSHSQINCLVHVRDHSHHFNILNDVGFRLVLSPLILK